MHPAGTDGVGSAATFLTVEDEKAASGSAARLLITAATPGRVEGLARRIHRAGLRAGLPFVHTHACDLPTTTLALSEHCAGFLDAARGGSVLISDIEDVPPPVQDVLLELLAALELARPSSAAVRLMSGTTVALLERVHAGAFSAQLFYRLNVFHLMLEERFSASAIGSR